MIVQVELPGVSVPYHFDRPDSFDGSQQAALNALAIKGARLADSHWGTISDEIIQSELDTIARDPRDLAPYVALGIAGSQDGFLRHHEAFTSLGDPLVSNKFRLVVDAMMKGIPPGGRPKYYDPLLTARQGFHSTIAYEDGRDRWWDLDAVYNHLTLAFAERGATFPDPEHLDKSHAHLYSASTLFRAMRYAYDLTHRELSPDIQQIVKLRIEHDFQFVENWSRFGDARLGQAGHTINELAGLKIVPVKTAF